MVAPFSLIQSQNQQNRHPFVLNFFIISIPVLFLASLTTITVLGHIENAVLFNSYIVLVELLGESPIQVVQALAANAQMTVDSARIISRWKMVWTVYSVFIGIALAVRRIRFYISYFASVRAERLTTSMINRCSSLRPHDTSIFLLRRCARCVSNNPKDPPLNSRRSAELTRR